MKKLLVIASLMVITLFCGSFVNAQTSTTEKQKIIFRNTGTKEKNIMHKETFNIDKSIDNQNVLNKKTKKNNKKVNKKTKECCAQKTQCDNSNQKCCKQQENKNCCQHKNKKQKK